MLYLRATVIGVLTALVCAVLACVIVVGIDLNRTQRDIGSAGIGSVSVGSADVGPAAAVGLIGGFAAGFYWTVRRGRRARTATSTQ